VEDRSVIKKVVLEEATREGGDIEMAYKLNRLVNLYTIRNTKKESISRISK
jgi:hypothetical protein